MSDAQILRDFSMTSDECMRAVCFCFCYAITLSMCFIACLQNILLDVVARECLDFMSNK